MSRVFDEFREMPRAYWVLWAGMLANRVGAFVLPFLMLYLTKGRGLDIGTAGMVLACYGPGSLAAGFLGGQLADRWGRKPAILLSLCGGAAALAALACARSIVEIVVSVAALGLLADIYRPAVSATISDLVPAHLRTRAFGYLYWAYNLGFAFAAFLAGSASNALGYGALFVVDAGTMLLAAVVIGLGVPETKPVVGHSASASPRFGAVVRDRVFMSFIAVTTLSGFLMVQVGSAVPVLMRGDHFTDAAYGRLVAINGILIVFLQPWLLSRLAQLDRTRVLVVGGLAMGGGFAFHAIAHTSLGHVGAVVLWTFGEMAILPTVAAVIADFAPLEQRGRYQGMYAMGWSVALTAGPWIGTQVLARGALPWAGMCLVAGGIFAVGNGLLSGVRRSREGAEAPLLSTNA